MSVGFAVAGLMLGGFSGVSAAGATPAKVSTDSPAVSQGSPHKAQQTILLEPEVTTVSRGQGLSIKVTQKELGESWLFAYAGMEIYVNGTWEWSLDLYGLGEGEHFLTSGLLAFRNLEPGSYKVRYRADYTELVGDELNRITHYSNEVTIKVT